MPDKSQLIVMFLLLCAAHCAGVWDGPTPDNVRKAMAAERG